MAVVLALSASLLYGAADFLGGLASRRQAVLGVVVASQAAGSLGLLLVLPLLPAALPGPADLALGAVGGLAGAVAVVCLYRGLAEGRMSVVAPVAALSGLTLPVAGGLAMGERPGALAVAGMALSALAVWLLGRGPSAVA
ncbi:MAG TPA: EamA family transporter, partial [Vicinamibacteria bacterium]